ncbi:MAG TPA: protein kinase [Gemmatimonadaceae bacterium]|nr:protein kinase [Gemmatimonadaceae bacterium]
MSDLQDRLQTALGDAYRIDRELGGGGMSHVFLATETALGRQVVVKVLPPEMAAGVNIDRFRREVQLAASLQHPHIVPLHAAGQAGDLFYYTMPLVEGESLRAKLAREGELPVGEAIRILRDVADALAYAHGRGVVHRDIKPDNILISGQHAVVTDFGVAKAMSAAAGSSSLTSLGVALGTPAYMAPEQAAADPHVDHRADLYALGAMAYEMLCGRPPFSGMSPQQVLAAHVTLAPAPLGAQRPSVPPALNTLVMRCLEKKPADRVQRADELFTQLQAMATPSGGMAPTGAQPAAAALTSGAEAALRRAHPVRVTALFAVASVAVLAVVWLLRAKLGLPDWVVPGAAVLLAIGLPVMLATGRLERERMIAATTGTFRVPDAGVKRFLTWRRAILGGGLAFGALALVVIGYTVMRVMGIGSVGTLQAKGILKERQPILLAEFENRSTDSTLGPTLTEAFRVDLSQSQSVKLMDGQAVSDALARMKKPANTLLTPDLAREVAVREGVPAVVVGEIDPVGKSYVVSAKVVAAADGASLTAVRETAASDAELIPALDRLSRALRERIGESLVSIRADQPLERVTTASLDALRKYTQGDRLADAMQEEAAIQMLQEAVAIDTAFAMAWRKLAVVISNMGGDYGKVVDASTRAYRYRDRLPEMEKQSTIAWYFDVVDHDPKKSMAAYRAMLAIDPDNTTALNNLSLALFIEGQYAEAESLAVRCTESGKFGYCYFHALRAQLLLHRPAAADSTLARWRHDRPGDPVGRRTAWGMASYRGDYAAAERELKELADAQRGSQYWQSNVSRDLGSTAAVQGRLSDAEQQFRRGAALADARGDGNGWYSGWLNIAAIDVTLRNDPAAARAALATAVAKHPLSAMSPSDRPYAQLAEAYAMAGRPDEAQRLLAEYARAVPEGVRRADPDQFIAAGQIALAQGKYAEAIASFQAGRVENQCVLCGVSEIAQAYAKLGQMDSAQAYYERYLGPAGPYRVMGDAYYLALTYQRLGEIYESKGDRKRAIDSYGKLADLWKNADPELQPVVKDAHARINRLTAEH